MCSTTSTRYLLRTRLLRSAEHTTKSLLSWSFRSSAGKQARSRWRARWHATHVAIGAQRNIKPQVEVGGPALLARVQRGSLTHRDGKGSNAHFRQKEQKCGGPEERECGWSEWPESEWKEAKSELGGTTGHGGIYWPWVRTWNFSSSELK